MTSRGNDVDSMLRMLLRFILLDDGVVEKSLPRRQPRYPTISYENNTKPIVGRRLCVTALRQFCQMTNRGPSLAQRQSLSSVAAIGSTFRTRRRRELQRGGLLCTSCK